MKIFSLLNILDKRIGRQKAKLENYLLFKIGKRKKFEYYLMRTFLKKQQKFSKDFKLYQSHPLIQLQCQRPTFCRYKIYGLKKYLNKKKIVLDVGGNIGFFSLYISSFVRSIDVVEYDKYLLKICEIVKNEFKILNVNLVNKDIKKFRPDKKYDMIFSFAVHKWIGEDIDIYINRLFNMLKKDGVILIESHINEKKLLDKLLNISDLKIIEDGFTDDHYGEIRYFYYIKKKK